LSNRYANDLQSRAVQRRAIRKYHRRQSTGPVYGLAVWAAGYAGWLPAMHILPPTAQRPLGRNLLLITAHLVWGAAAEATAAAAAAPER
jgi:uncharacterized membrane protein YagU involved in acid resistance